MEVVLFAFLGVVSAALALSSMCVLVSAIKAHDDRNGGRREPVTLDDRAVLIAAEMSRIRTRAACSAKSCENMGDDGLCGLACIFIDGNGHCRMANTKETVK